MCNFMILDMIMWCIFIILDSSYGVVVFFVVFFSLFWIHHGLFHDFGHDHVVYFIILDSLYGVFSLF